jgi:hypothetical protein
MKKSKISFLILPNVFLCININAQTNWPNLSEDTPSISVEDYEPPLFDAAKKLWLPDSIESSYDFKVDSMIFKNIYEKTKTTHLKISESTLIAGISNSDVNNRRMFIISLTNANNIEIYRIIGEKLLLDSDLFVQQFALKKIRDTIIQSNKVNLEQSISFIHNRKSQIELGKTLIVFGEDSIGFKILQSVFFRSTPQEQIEMLYYIRKIKLDKSRDFLSNVAKLKDDFVSTSAALILAQLGERKVSFEKLSGQINNSERFIKIIAIIGLAYLHDEKSLELIKNKISDPDKKVKNIAYNIYSNLKQ